jgi:zinc protease
MALPASPEASPARSAVIAVALLTLTCALAGAQEPAPNGPAAEGLVRKRRAPISEQLLSVTLPKVVESDLGNGVHLMVLEDHRAPQVSFQLVIPWAGGYYDPPEAIGRAAIAAAMMREGTRRRSSTAIAQTLEVMAATLDVSAGLASPDATISGSSGTDEFPRLFELAADVLLHPTFPDEELSRYKQRMRATLQQQRANPTFLASEIFSRAIYGVHPGSRLSPSPATLESVTREELEVFHRTRYLPGRAALAIAGDISPAKARRLAQSRLSDWKNAAAPDAIVTDPSQTTGRRVYFVERPGSVQTNLVAGAQAIGRTDPDYDVLALMNKVIGGGPTGRLFLHLREEKGYTYGAGSTLTAPQYQGAWQAATSVRTEVTGPALNDLMAEITRLREEPVPAAELAEAKRAMIAEDALAMESPAQIISLHLQRWRYKLPLDYWDRRAERLTAITAAQVQAAARRYLAPDRLQLVAVGDPLRVLPILEPLGAVEIYDVEGEPLAARSRE